MVLVGKSEGNKPLGKLDVDAKITLKRNLQEMGWGSWTGIDLSESRDRCCAFVNAAMNNLASINAVKFLTNLSPYNC